MRSRLVVKTLASARSSNQPETAADLREPQVRVVLAQHQPVLRAAREHAVRLARAAGDEVVDQHSDIGFVTAWIPGLAILRSKRGVHPGHESLRGRLLVTGGAVDLAGEEQVLRRGASPSHGRSSRGSK